MILFKRAEDLRKWLSAERNKGRTIAFVPTMGALHEGHIHLISEARKFADITICSIFVNPVQFNDPKDFQKYPVSTEADIRMLSQAETGVLFLPSVEEIYPGGQSGLETYELGSLESILEGRYRPGHFQGVCQVMSRLLAIVHPDHLVMGQKDFQQCLVVQRLIALLSLGVHFHSIPTVREEDGLAKSSRNRRLTPEQRQNAVAISRALLEIRQNLSGNNEAKVLDAAREILNSAHFRTDYVEVARVSDLQPIENWNGKDKAVALIAAFQGEVRLIDNLLLN